MSFIFEIDDETVWSPSLRVGELYVRILQDVGATLGLSAGMTAVASEMCDIEVEDFEVLVRKMFETRFSSSRQVFIGLIDGVLAPSIIMRERGDRVIVPGSDAEQDFINSARDLSMSR